MHKLFDYLDARDLASFQKELDMVETELVRDLKGRSLLHYAILKEYNEAIDLLLERGLSVNLLDTNFETCLFDACRKGDASLINLLISHNANLNLKNKRGDTPLHLAAFRGKTEIYDLLVTAGASETEVNNQQMNVIHFAILGGNLELVKTLYKRIGKTSDVDAFHSSYLHYASKSSNSEIFEFFLNKKMDINELNSLYQTPLYNAVRLGDLAMTEYIINAGAYLNIVDKNHETIYDLCNIYNLEYLKQYLESISQNEEIVSTHEKDKLIIAVLNRDLFLVEQYLMSGENFKHKNRFNLTCSDYASKYQLKTILDLIKSFEKNGQSNNHRK